MVPTVTAIEDDLQEDFAIYSPADAPSHTYRLDLESKRVAGFVDSTKAMEQAIFKILQTERYDFPKVYSNNYGVELRSLIGKPIPFVLPEIERRVTEALTWDDRINNVSNFEFDVAGKVVHTSFVASTIFGDIKIETEVDI